MDDQVRSYFCGVVIFAFIIILFVSIIAGISISGIQKNNARLDKLEADSTTAQQPQERHYLKPIETWEFKLERPICDTCPVNITVDNIGKKLFVYFYSK
jgi:hypothetical protein